MSVPVSIVVLTKNEEEDLPSCLDTIQWSDDIHIVDSGSTDETTTIAQAAGASVYTNPFEGFGAQRNWALDNCNLQHEWVLFLDADEHATESFRTQLGNAINTANGQTAGFYCCWKMMLNGTWLKHSDSFPKWQFRVVRRGRARFENFGHGQREFEIDGKLEYLTEPYLHFAFSKGWSQWLTRHNTYSSQEARLRLNGRAKLNELFSSHAAVRRKSLRYLASRLPGWPILRFLIMYVLKLGFLDGKSGFVYCLNMAYYEFLIQLKMAEMRRAENSKS